MFFFFCKQKTAYEMRISDWSSDVCSSDLRGDKASEAPGDEPGVVDLTGGDPLGRAGEGDVGEFAVDGDPEPDGQILPAPRQRSEERRGGKEGVSTGRSGWSPLP